MDDFDLRTTAMFTREGWSTRELAAAVRSGAIEQPRRGLYTPTGERDAGKRHALACAAACRVRHPDSVVSHTSAAVLHGLPVRAGALELVDLTRWGREHGKLAAGVRLHRTLLRDDEIVEINGLRVTTLERTVVDLAREEPYGWGVVAADAALRRQVDRAVWLEYVEHGRRVRGNRRLGEVVAFADGRSESALESMSRVSIARAGLPAPVLQQPVRDANGGWIADGDFGWPDVAVIGESDGKEKYVVDPNRDKTAADVIVAEKNRDTLIEQCGWRVVRWSWGLATDHVALGSKLRAAFRWRRVG